MKKLFVNLPEHEKTCFWYACDDWWRNVSPTTALLFPNHFEHIQFLGVLNRNKKKKNYIYTKCFSSKRIAKTGIFFSIWISAKIFIFFLHYEIKHIIINTVVVWYNNSIKTIPADGAKYYHYLYQVPIYKYIICLLPVLVVNCITQLLCREYTYFDRRDAHLK